MSLTPITRPAKARRFAVYDLEWIPHTLELRVIGTIEPGGQYRAFTDMGTFLDYALHSERRGTWYYAHAGGLYDVQFVFDYILQHRRTDYEIDAKFSGSSAIIVKVRRGKNCWYFLDSFWLLRASLREIGKKMVGLEKGGLDSNEGKSKDEIEAYYRDTPLPELIDYNRTDCEILFRAIGIFQEALFDLGGQLQMTLASSAMQLFRRKYLTSAIKTRSGVNETARSAYVGSRVEVLAKKCESANYYDINSSFPYAMTSPAPGRLLQMRRTIPHGEGQLYIARAIVESPETHLPPIPIRGATDGRIYFPSGTWEGHFTNVDLELLEEAGGAIHQVKEVLVFEPFTDLADYARDLYERRRPLDESDPMRTILKLLLNSLYGKFAESHEKQALFVNPPASFFEDPKIISRELMSPGVWLAWQSMEVEHAHVPIAAHITALARRNLYRFMVQCKETYYCDTDGFACDLGSEFTTGDALGALKLEKVLRPEESCHFHPQSPILERTGTRGVCSACGYELSPGGVFLSPKQYTMHTDKGKRIVKSKGFQRLTYEDFLRLEAAEDVELERMVRLRENLRAGRTMPVEKVYLKGLRNAVRPKRCFEEDGSSRPWTIDELAKPWKQPVPAGDGA